MTDDATEKSYSEIQSERFRRELPGTIGCVTTYGFMSLIACSIFLPFPYGLIAATCLALLYVGSIVMFGEGSILEMGVIAVILLVLACLCGRIIGDINRPSNLAPTTIENDG